MVPPRTPQTLRPRPVSRDATGRLLDRSGPGRRRSLPLFPFLAVLLPILLAGCGEGAPFPALAATVAQALPGMAAGSGTEGHAVGTDGRPLDADTGPVEITEPVHPVVAFLELPAADSATEARALDELDEGLSLWRGGDRRAGADQVDRALALLPTLADWRPLIRAELLAADGDTAGVRLALEEVVGIAPAFFGGDKTGAKYHEQADCKQQQSDQKKSAIIIVRGIMTGHQRTPLYCFLCSADRKQVF